MESSPKKGLADRVAHRIAKAIRSGTHAPGDYLPSERLLAEQFSVSRITIRRALSHLKEQGIIGRHVGRGTYVLTKEARPSRPRVAVLHTPQNTWLLGEMHVIMRGAFEGLQACECDYEALVWTDHPEVFDRDVKLLLPEQITELGECYEALLFMEATHPSLQEPLRALLKTSRVPVVVANYERNDLDVHCTCVNHMEVAEKAVELLARLGHRRIAYIGRRPERLFYGVLLDGFRRGCKRAGVDIPPACEIFLEDTNPYHALATVEKLLDSPTSPTGIFLGRDRFGGAVLEALQQRGLQAGLDVSMVGFDDVTLPARDPILTTFREPCYELGFTAAEMVHELLVNGPRPPERRVLDTPLVLRRTLGPPPIATHAIGLDKVPDNSTL